MPFGMSDLREWLQKKNDAAMKVARELRIFVKSKKCGSDMNDMYVELTELMWKRGVEKGTNFGPVTLTLEEGL